MKALGAIAEFLPIAVAVLLIAHIIKTTQEPREDEPPILPPEDWPEEYARKIEEEIRKDRQTRKERRRKP